MDCFISGSGKIIGAARAVASFGHEPRHPSRYFKGKLPNHSVLSFDAGSGSYHIVLVFQWFAIWEGHVGASALEASLFVKMSAFMVSPLSDCIASFCCLDFSLSSATSSSRPSLFLRLRVPSQPNFRTFCRNRTQLLVFWRTRCQLSLLTLSRYAGHVLVSNYSTRNLTFVLDLLRLYIPLARI